ncbi:MAG: hypothetical protein MZU97_10520 [Bacillus subtilis]|nr:hypothetical protein [Bacillus subtilis]
MLGTSIGSRTIWKRNSIGAKVLDGYIVVSNAVPDYIVALIFITVFAFNLGWFPNQGAYNALLDPGFNIIFILSLLYFAFLPISAHVFSRMSFWSMQMQGARSASLARTTSMPRERADFPKKQSLRNT